MSSWRTITCPGRNAAQAKRSDALQNRDHREGGVSGGPGSAQRHVGDAFRIAKMPQRARDTIAMIR